MAHQWWRLRWRKCADSVWVSSSPSDSNCLIDTVSVSWHRYSCTCRPPTYIYKVTSQSEPTEQDLDQKLKETAQLTMVSQLLCVDDSSSSQMILSSYLEYSLDPHRFLMKLINSNVKAPVLLASSLEMLWLISCSIDDVRCFLFMGKKLLVRTSPLNINVCELHNLHLWKKHISLTDSYLKTKVCKYLYS